MIRGARLWAERITYYSQQNNPTEELLRKRVEQSRLESCGPTAAVNCLAVLDYDLTVTCPGRWRPQPEEVLMDWFHDPRNHERLAAIRQDIDPRETPGNRVPQYYPLAVADVFAAQAHFGWIDRFDLVGEYLCKGYCLQICLKNPGHFIAAVAYDDETDEIIYRDPWPDRLPDHNGFNRRLNIDEYRQNIKPYAIVYRGRES